SIDGLAAMVQEQFGLNPFSSALFVFCNRRREKLKWYEEQFRLAQQKRFGASSAAQSTGCCPLWRK
ncbi:transposase and inactivated derivative, partial [Paenibacillus popilliae ATCC 14706]